MKWPLSKTFHRISTLSRDLHGRVVLAIFLLSSLLALTTAMGCHTFLVAHDTSMPLTPSVLWSSDVVVVDRSRVRYVGLRETVPGPTHLFQENSNYTGGSRECRLSRTPYPATGHA